MVLVSAVGPTAVKFLNSDKLGKGYENDMFVGDFNNGYIYHFELNEDRTELGPTAHQRTKYQVGKMSMNTIYLPRVLGA